MYQVKRVSAGESGLAQAAPLQQLGHIHVIIRYSRCNGTVNLSPSPSWIFIFQIQYCTLPWHRKWSSPSLQSYTSTQFPLYDLVSTLTFTMNCTIPPPWESILICNRGSMTKKSNSTWTKFIGMTPLFPSLFSARYQYITLHGSIIVSCSP